jgi:hypothetical protein
MQKPKLYLPELDWSDAGGVSVEFMNLYAGVKVPVRGPGVWARTLGTLQSARRCFTAAAGWTVLKVTKSPNVCQARGHQIVGRPWVEIPGHYENWHRLVGCECGHVLKLQSCHNHQNPALSFLAPKKDNVA